MGRKADRTGFFRRGRVWYTIDPVTSTEKSTGFTELGAARAWRARREYQAANPAAYAAESATLGDECSLMLEHLRTIGRSVAYYEAKLGHWPRVLGNDRRLATVDPTAFDAFIAVRRGEGVTDHTISKELKCAITMLRNAKRAGRYAGDLSVLRPHGFSDGYVPRTRALTLPELGRLLGELDGDAWAFVVLCVGLGLRRGEALALRPVDIDLVDWEVRVRGTKTAGAARTIPVLGPFRELVRRAAESLPLGAWARSQYYTRSLAVRCARAGIPTVTANDLRRTHATLLRTAGVGADVARALLGHTRGSVLLEQTYDKPRAADLAARAGDLSGFTAQVQVAAEARKLERHDSISRGETAQSAGPWGPSPSLSSGGPPTGTGTYAIETGREPVRAGEDPRKRVAPQTELSAGGWALYLAAESALGPKDSRATHRLTGSLTKRGRRDVG